MEAFASGLKIVVIKNNDLISKFFYSRGGELPAGYSNRGWAVVPHRGRIWVIGEDHGPANKAVERMAAMVEAGEIQ